ncbi:Biotin synthase [hydrothermal vent metagenome]|uniref:biotin synthase n=1 Tax=hydrothermal vent metagenome TaxID=652676 RepID=A0A3B1B0J7_9ZZZZ
MTKLAEARLKSIRHDWSDQEIEALFTQPFADLMFAAQNIHRQHFDPNEVQVSTLLSIKTGKCSEDCAYCPQSVRYDTEVEDESLLELDAVISAARQAKQNGASRFCMGAAWRRPKDKDLDKVIDMVVAVKEEGLESCLTLGMLTEAQTQRLKNAGLDYYNHNLDSSPEYYKEVITTRTYDDRLETLAHVRNAGINVCCGGILGMGESRKDRVGLMRELTNQAPHPESVPINMLVRVEGTPLEAAEDFDPIEFVRCIAVARILMPKSHVRLSAGREEMTDEMQALCFLAGANSIFYGEKLLTTPNPGPNQDMKLFDSLGIKSV